MPIITVLICLLDDVVLAGMSMGSQAEATTPWVPIILIAFIFAAVFLLVRLTWGLVKSRLKKQ